jgi:hypothetical protein
VTITVYDDCGGGGEGGGGCAGNSVVVEILMLANAPVLTSTKMTYYMGFENCAVFQDCDYDGVRGAAEQTAAFTSTTGLSGLATATTTTTDLSACIGTLLLSLQRGSGPGDVSNVPFADRCLHPDTGLPPLTDLKGAGGFVSTLTTLKAEIVEKGELSEAQADARIRVAFPALGATGGMAEAGGGVVDIDNSNPYVCACF